MEKQIKTKVNDFGVFIHEIVPFMNDNFGKNSNISSNGENYYNWTCFDYNLGSEVYTIYDYIPEKHDIIINEFILRWG